MFKRWMGVVVLALISVLSAGAGAQTCEIANNFTGANEQFPGNYSIGVPPGATGTLTAVCSAGVNSYNWFPGGALTQSIQVTAPQSGSVSYGVTGCITSSLCAPPVAVSILVDPAAPDCTLSASPNPAVSGQTVTFNVSCTPPADGIEYTDLSGTPRSTTATTFTDVAPVVTQQTVRNVFYHGYTNAGAIGPDKVLPVTINPAPLVVPPQNCTLTAQPNPVTINNSFTLTAVCSAGDPVTTYTFVGPNGQAFASGPGNTATVQATTLGALNYQVRAANAGGQASASTTVNVVPPPPSGCTLNAAPNPVLLGAQTILTAQCSGGGTPTTFALTPPSGPVVTQATGTFAVVPASVGNQVFSVVVSNAGGSAPAATTTVVVQQAGCTITPSVPNPVPRGTTLSLAASCNNQPVFYQWSTPAGPISGQNGASISVSPTVTTTYTVSASNASTAFPVVATGQYTVVVSNATAIANISSATITGIPGRPLSRSLDVRVTDQAGNPVANELVNWSVVNPGPNPGTFASNPSAPTNAQGQTSNTFTMGADPGGRTLRACLATLPAVCADFTVIPGASQITPLPGGPLVGGDGRTLRELAVQVRDPQGNVVPGETVNWTVVNPGPNPGTFAVNPSAPTDTQGITRNTFTMGGDPGGRLLRACLALVPTACADFVVRTLNAALERPATKIMAPMAEVALATPLTQLHNIRLHLEQLRLRRNPSVIEALRVSVAGKPLPSFSAFALAPLDKNGKPVPQRGGGAAADQDPFERLGFFVNGEIEIGKQSSTGIQNGYDLSTKGLTAGVDYRLPGESVVGLAGGYMHANTDLNDGGGSQGASGYSFSAYGSFVPAAGAYVDMIAHAGNNKYDTRRREVTDFGAPVDYFSNTRGNQFALAITAGADINRGAVTMNPYLRLDYIDARIDGFSESGDDGAIAIRDLKLKSTVVTLGGQVSYAMSTSWGVLMPNARLELQHRVHGDGHNVTASLVADGTINALAPLEPIDRSYGNVSIGASAVLPKGVSGFVNIERLFGRESYSNTKYTVGVRFEF